MRHLWYLENIDLYHILCPHKIGEYAEHSFKRFRKGDFIYQEHEASSKIYLISRGKVKIMAYTADGTEHVKAILSKGEIFGEQALLGEKKRGDYAIACDNNTELCPLSVEIMYDLMRKNERFSLTIYKLMGLRFRKLERRLENLVYKDTRTRLLDFISELLQHRELNEQKPIEVEHFYTQKDIADLIGAKRETVSKNLKQLDEEGLLTYHRRSIIIHRPYELAQMTAA